MSEEYCPHCGCESYDDETTCADRIAELEFKFSETYWNTVGVEIMQLKKTIAELEKWYDLLSDGGWINVGDTPEEGIESLRVLIESPKNTAELEAKLKMYEDFDSAAEDVQVGSLRMINWKRNWRQKNGLAETCVLT